jgi:hypothetical protein
MEKDESFNIVADCLLSISSYQTRGLGDTVPFSFRLLTVYRIQSARSDFHAFNEAAAKSNKIVDPIVTGCWSKWRHKAFLALLCRIRIEAGNLMPIDSVQARVPDQPAVKERRISLHIF